MQQSILPTLEEVEELAQQLGVEFANTGDGWIDLTKSEPPVLEGMYRNNQDGINSAYGALKRLELTLQATQDHQQNRK